MWLTAYARLIRWLTPADNRAAQLRVEQLCAVAQNCNFLLVDVVIVALLIAIDSQWVSFKAIAPWSIGVLLSVLLAVAGTRYLFRRERKPAEAGRLTLAMLGAVLPLTSLWPMMVLFVWVDGNLLNNAFLITFLFASMTVGVAVFSASPHLVMPGLVITQLILTTHPMKGNVPHDWLAVPLQTVAGFLLFCLAYVFQKIFRSAMLLRLEKDELVASLQVARDAAIQANQAKSSFLANMSHELRTPLNAIIGFTDMIRQRVLGPLSPAKYGEYIDDVHRSGRHLLDLINDILDLAKIEAGRLELEDVDIDLAALTAQATEFVRPQAEAAMVTIQASVAPLDWLIADKRSLLQILTNLLSNSVKFSRPGGVVRVFTASLPDGGLAIGVEDDGIGMTEEGVRKALEPFGQAQANITVEGRGTGLGLPIVKALIEAHGATFQLESSIGKGTRIWGEFPPRRVANRRAVA
jgi:signal transduction histidine kinase